MRIETVSSEKGEYMWISGPASIQVIRGNVELLGARYEEGDTIVLHKCRSYIARLGKDTEIRLVLGEGSSYERGVHGEIMEEWLRAADTAVLKDGAVLVLGGVEAGKSTFTALVANRGLARGKRVAVIDGDIGQADIGPPATVSMGFPATPITWLRSVKPRSMRFIGSITPGSAWPIVIEAIMELYWEAVEDGANLVVVDTDGWIKGGQAVNYKLRLVRALRPSLSILIGGEGLELASMLEGAGFDVVRVRSPSRKRTRSRVERRELRRDAYRRFLEKADIRVFDLEKLVVLGSELSGGTPLPDGELEFLRSIVGPALVHALRIGGEYYLVINEPIPRSRLREAEEALGARIRIGVSRACRGLLVGILDSRLRDVSIGVVENIDYGRGRMAVRTPWKKDVGGIAVGRIFLDENYAERGRVRDCLI